MYTQGGKGCPVAGPEAALQVLSWQIDGLPRGNRLVGALEWAAEVLLSYLNEVDVGADEMKDPGGAWKARDRDVSTYFEQAIAPDGVPDLDQDLVAMPGDRCWLADDEEPTGRFRIRLHIQGRWRMVDWEKLPKALSS